RHRPSGLVAHLPAHVGEEFPFGGGEAFDTTRQDLVEHAVDLCLCRRARGATVPEAGVSGPGATARLDPNPRVPRPPPMARRPAGTTRGTRRPPSALPPPARTRTTRAG